MGEEEAPDVQLRRAISRTAKEARALLRMTQAEVAEVLGMAPEVYGRIERGEFMPSVLTLVNIATVLRVTPDQLLGWSELKTKNRSDEHERIVVLLERADESNLKRVEALVKALLSVDAKA